VVLRISGGIESVIPQGELSKEEEEELELLLLLLLLKNDLISVGEFAGGGDWKLRPWLDGWRSLPAEPPVSMTVMIIPVINLSDDIGE
jgi:hypothetical protein